jgi:hypothetical protein
LIDQEYCECSLMEEKLATEPQSLEADPPFYYQTDEDIEPIPRMKIDQGYGYCPVPSQLELYRFIGNFTQLAGNATNILHTNDRKNMKAYYELLVDEENSISDIKIANETWADVVET